MRQPKWSILAILALGPVVGATLVLGPAPLFAQDAAEGTSEGEAMTRQTALGIGGLFIRSTGPAALSAWYEKHLGINPVPTSYEDKPWVQEAGPTILAPMPADAEGMIPKDKTWMLNLRVADLDAFAAQLQAEGIAVTVDPQDYPNGRFATLADPEGNPIQLWEPALP